MIRVVLALLAVTMIMFGLGLIASDSGLRESRVDDRPQIAAAPRPTASPVMLGTALLAGGVAFLVLIFRRR